ncbi:radical SAM/SPASM domain-containing protein [Paenibacillus sp.]|uniref:radical SAM/SPASM domain-containing protein n=1 Tax=Paenibacillus sp. TaxID=58172 RepID=UPI0028A947D4|nr:radical SAM protein [Paenibacillus sp.]
MLNLVEKQSLQLSPFVIFKNDPESDEITCYSTVTNKIVKLSSEESMHIFNEILNHSSSYDSENNPIINVLKDYGILTEDKNLQRKNIINKVNSILYSNDTLEVTILPTDACNFNCSYCYQKPPYKIMSEETESRIIDFFKKNINKYKTVRINWFGGEPLLQKKQIVRMMESINIICKKNGVPLISRMTTNGYGLDLDTFNAFIKNRLLFFQITLDGPQRIHDQHRPLKNGDPTFDVILNNLRRISEETQGKFFQIFLRVNVTPNMIEHMDEFLDMYHQYFGNDKRFVLGFERVQDWGGKKIEDLRKHENIFSNTKGDEEFYSLYEKAEKYSLNLNYRLVNDLEPLICLASKSNGYVFNHNGDILKCPMAIYSEEKLIRESNKIGEITQTGNLSCNKNKDFWEGPNQVDKCKGCSIFPICFGLGCPLGISFKGTSPCKEYDHRVEMINKYINSTSIKEEEILVI